ncbi:MAG TPA: 5-oxoprolinase subunit PxpB [Rhodanobacteraceae bacterium]|nr:5-oxoprolinase subunit PxpB [Rhodanobacteraceae bacterium]
MDFTAEPLSEDSLLLRFGATIDPAINARVHAAAARMRAAQLPGITEIAPAYASLLLCFEQGSGSFFEKESGSFRRAVESILAAVSGQNEPDPFSGREIDIPVCYGGAHGPDLVDIAQHAGLDVYQVIERHAAREYMVAMLGFAPGFPYLLGLDRALHTPRRLTPRTRVPAGSVAIGGSQTGIYPRELPGGWMLIGRTPLALFDPQRDPPCLLAPGDRVRFRAIDAGEFIAMRESPQ